MIFPHIQIDGDAIGSAVALCEALRRQGKQSWIFIEEKLPETFRFLDKGYCTTEQDIVKNPDLCVCVDCGQFHRFPAGRKTFLSGKVTICIDHHETTEAFADYNYIDHQAAATAELIFALLKELAWPITKTMAEALFTGISGDTGKFHYSNTTAATHLMVAELYDLGLDVNKVAVELYQNVRAEKIKITYRVLETMEFFAGGKAAIAYATEEMLKETGADMSDIDGVVETMRDIQGVEVAVLVKEKSATAVKVSMRTKTETNVMDIAARYEGGGHRKAAGCTIRAGVTEAIKLLSQEVETMLEN